MKSSRDIHGELLSKYERELAGLKTYIKELTDRAAEYGTEREHFEQDLLEAEHNVKYYEDEIARIKAAGGAAGAGAGGGQTAGDTILPRTAKQGIGSLLVSVISFAAGALFGSKVRSRKGGKDGGEGSEGQ
jgi:hypothetical protein